jgi:rhodanese-related sulfurtransferase
MSLSHIRPAQLATWVNEQLALDPQTPPVVLDVREPWELGIASVEAEIQALGARFLHVPMRSVPDHVAEWPETTPMACLCHHGVRSQHVAHFLVADGMTRVANITGGIDAWSRDLNPTVPVY